MAKYKVLQDFRDIHTKEIHEKDAVIEMTEDRANEAIKNLSKYTGEFLERIEEVTEYEKLTHDELEKVNNDDLKNRLDELAIEYDSKATKKDLIALLKGDEKTEEDQEATEENEEG